MAAWSGGAWQGGAPRAPRGFSVDTRTLEPGEVYVAIRGPRHDGHDFVDEAFARGACGAVVSRAFAGGRAAGAPLLCVDDPVTALGAMARGYRRSLSAEIIAVTGSVGKTSVKEMVADALATRAVTARTMGNFNNDIGLPLSLLAMDPAARFGVFELGMNHPGELAGLCAMLQPSWGIVTNVGPVHIEFFDSVEAIAREKAAVISGLTPGGAAVINRDTSHFDILKQAAACRVITTSLDREADYTGRLASKRGGRFTVTETSSEERADFEIPLPGRYAVENALLAIAVGRAHGVPWDELRRVLAAYVPQPLRWNRCDIGGVLVVNDAYNANPVSMKAALEAFAEMPVKGRRWLVLGGMLELGRVEEQEHRELGQRIACGDWAGLVTVGRLGALVADGAVEGDGLEVVRCTDHAEAARAIRERAGPGDAVLVKASRGEKLENVVEEWRKAAGE